ncbi:histidine phosphatase super family protein, partial [Vibrio parahaemolyticus V-223/04]|jgi:hypothetical protein
MLKTV